MAETTETINPVQIVFMTYQLRQAEIQRNDTKNARNREAMTMRIRKLKQELDPLLERFAEQEKKKRADQPQMNIIGADPTNKDHGPEEVITQLHAYAQQKLTQVAVTNHIANGEPVSIAGEYDGYVYIMHFEKSK